MEGAVPFLRIGRAGVARVLVPMEGIEWDDDLELLVGIPVSWKGALWMWLWPRGPFFRLDPASMEVVERWDPEIASEENPSWQATPSSGPDDTLIFAVHGSTEGDWIVFDEDRRMIVSQPIPDGFRTLRFATSEYAAGFVWDEAYTFRVPLTVRVFKYEVYPR